MIKKKDGCSQRKRSARKFSENPPKTAASFCQVWLGAVRSKDGAAHLTGVYCN